MPGVRYIHHGIKLSVGAKRNLGCELARGEIVAHWDDDDYSAPGRVEDQVQRLTESGKAVTGYHSMRFTDGREWWLYTGPGNYSLGTALCYLRSWWQTHRFEPFDVGEDNLFVARASAHGQLICVPADDMMWASIHQTNTSPRALHSQSWRKLEAQLGMC